VRRHRKPKVVWLPRDASSSVRTDGRSSVGFNQIVVNNTTIGNGGTDEFPIVADFTQENPAIGSAAETLSDLENSGYRLRRIVGKIFVSSVANANDPNGNTNASWLVVTAGIMVRRIDEATGVSHAFTAGEAAVDDTLNVRDPWIWRRSWSLGAVVVESTNAQQDALPLGVIGASVGIPRNNWSHGPSALDGPHVDAKTARIIGPEERLVLNVTARVILNGANTAEIVVVAHELRVLASMRTNVGNRRNSSR